MGLFEKSAHKEVTPDALSAMVGSGKAIVVDVREADEFAAGHIPGAVNVPLSDFSPDKLPHTEGKLLVLNCLGGKRSGLALDKCGVAQSSVNTHLAGGFDGWSKAGLPVER